MPQGKRWNIDPDDLADLYVRQRLSLSQMASQLGVCQATVWNKLKALNIPVRSSGEALTTDLAGREIGHWRVTHEKSCRDGKHLRWKCVCGLCLKTYWVLARSLYSEASTKCEPCRRRLHRKGFEQLNGTHWRAILAAAKLRGIAVEISPEQAWRKFVEQDGRCVLSGLPITFGYKSETTASLDRIDNGRGYVPGNCQWLHKDINRMKWAHGQDYFLTLCRAVTTHTERSTLEQQQESGGS